MSLEKSGKSLKRADSSTIQDKVLVGYQGWFTCAGDGVPIGHGHHGWLHWFNYPIPDGGRPNTDVWPDVSEYHPSELFPAPGLCTQSGDQCFLFSSRHPTSVQRHFHWMARHGVDGAFLQRFAGQCDLETPGNEGIFRIRDEVGDHVRQAAEKEGRVFAIMYDVTGVAPGRIQGVIERDWVHLIGRKKILDSPSYLREQGKAVVALWGFGFADKRHSPSVVRDIVSYLRRMTPGGAYIMAGVPAHWRTSVQDADPNPDFVNVWLNDVDAISPWTIGRYENEDEADRFANEKMKGDTELIKRTNDASGGVRRVDYVPVIFPGGSGYNLSEGAWGFNNIKRNGGRFLWRQIFNAHQHGARIIYGAMWDEYDEGTAFMPIVPSESQLPVSNRYRFLALDAEGYNLPSDWYMRICGFAAEGLRVERTIQETFPQKDLTNYWSTRPRYEERAKSEKDGFYSTLGASGSGPSGRTFVVENPDEPPPPPYTLEAGTTAPKSAPQSGVPDGPAVGGSSVAFRASPPPATSAPRPTSTQGSTYPVSDLVGDMGRQSLTASPFSQPPPLPPRSTAPLDLPPRPNMVRHSSSESIGPFLPMPSIPSFPAFNSNPSGPYPPPSNDPYSAWSHQPGQYQASYYGPPPPLRPRPSAYVSPAEPNLVYDDQYSERRRVQSSAAAYRPSSPPSPYAYPPGNPDGLSFPQAFDGGYSRRPGFTPYQQYPQYGPPPPLLPGTPSSYFPPPNPQDYASATQQYGPPPRPPSSSSPNQSWSNSSSFKKAEGSVLDMAKEGVDKLIGKQTRKSIRLSIPSALNPFSKK